MKCEELVAGANCMYRRIMCKVPCQIACEPVASILISPMFTGGERYTGTQRVV